MAHEQSETIQNTLGKWINVYGRTTPKAGQQLPGTLEYNTVEEAVSAAKQRSHEYGMAQQAQIYINPKTGERAVFDEKTKEWVISSPSAPVIEAARQQAGEVAAQPEYQEQIRQAGAEGRSQIGNALLNLAPSLAASIATGGAGGAIPMLSRGLPALITRAAGQGAAEVARQGITGEDITASGAGEAAALSGASDVIFGGVGKGIKALARKSPGVNARISERELAKTKDFTQSMSLTVDKAGVDAAYKSLTDSLRTMGNGFVQLKQTTPVIKSVIQEMKNRPAAQKQAGILKRFAALEKQGPGSAPFQMDQVEPLLKDVNAAMFATTNKNEKRLLMEVKQAIYRDLDNAQVPQAQKNLLRQAVRKARESFARGDLHDAIEAGISRSNVTGSQIINPKRILEEIDWLKANDKLFKNSFNAGDLEKLESFFTRMAQNLRGFSPEGTAIILAGLGGLAGSSVGDLAGQPGPGAAVGAAAGVSLPSMFTSLALNPKGADLILRMFGTGKPIAQPILVALTNAFAASQRGAASSQ